MSALSDDDLDLAEMSDEELERAWDLWFSLARCLTRSQVSLLPSHAQL